MFAFDATALGEEPGGYSRYVAELATCLASYQDVCILHRKNWKPSAKQMARCSSFKNRLLTEQLWLPGQTGDFGVVHIPAYAGPLLGTGATPMIVTLHDTTHTRSDAGGSWRDRWYWRNVLPRNLKRARFLITDSVASHTALAERYPVFNDKLRVIYPGVSPLPIGELPSVVPPEPFILVVGLTPARKRTELIIAAHQQMQIDIPLVLVGSFAGKIPDGKKVIVTGAVTDEELGALYKHAAFLAYPSTDEGFGLPPLEAFLAGCPVLAAPSAAVRETSSEGCRYVDSDEPDIWADEFDDYIWQEEEQRQRVELGLRQAADFSWEKTCRQLYKLYGEAAG